MKEITLNLPIMQKDTILVTRDNLIGTFAYCIYQMSPDNKPRNIEVIMKKLVEIIKEDFTNENEFYFKYVDDLASYVKNIVFSISEMVDLNLSHNEIIAGVGVNDANRPKYNFVTAYDIHGSESWKNDFVDLDALVGNVTREYLILEKVYR